jgi:transcriptional regulator with XRE-family HTH domain
MPKFESLEDWIDKKWITQGALGEKLGVASNTVSQWVSGKSRIKPPMQAKIRALGFDGPFPEGRQEVTQEDLQALGRDLQRVVGYAHEDLKQDILTLGAAVQELLKRFGASK